MIKVGSDMRDMFWLQFLNDIFQNLLVLVEISKVEDLEAKEFHFSLEGKLNTHNNDVNKTDIVQGLSNNQYSIILLGFAIGGYISRVSLYEYTNIQKISMVLYQSCLVGGFLVLQLYF